MKRSTLAVLAASALLALVSSACGSTTAESTQCDVDFCPAKFAAETDALGSIYSIELSDDEIADDVDHCEIVELDGDEAFYFDYVQECAQGN